jgi:hypothetical protein
MTVFAQNTVPNTETPTNSIAHVRDLAAQGLGWEDIVVALRADGLRIGVNARERIRQIVLKRTSASEAGPGRVPLSEAEKLLVTVQPPTRNAD